MENKNQQYNGFGVIRDAHVSVVTQNLSLYIKFDSKETIYQLKFESADHQIANFISLNFDFFSELSVAKLSSIFNYNFLGDFSASTKNFVLRQFVLAVRDYIGYPGALTEQDSSIDKDILCHCSKLSFNAFEKEFIKVRGNSKEAIFNTMAKSFCDSCDQNVDNFIKELDAKNIYFMGQDKQIWIDKLDKLIEEFYLFCPPEYNNIKFKVSSLKYNKIIIKCEKGESALNRKEIQATLNNYLTSELDEEIIFSVIT
jgi:hypothetical protein